MGRIKEVELGLILPFTAAVCLSAMTACGTRGSSIVGLSARPEEGRPDTGPLDRGRNGGLPDADTACGPGVANGGTFSAVSCANAFHGPNRQLGYTVVVDGAGNLIVAGSFYGSFQFGTTTLTSAGETDLFVAKLDSACQPVWAKSFGDPADQHGGMAAVDSNGNVYVAVNNRGTVDFGGGPLPTRGDYDIAVARFDPDGNYIWSRSFGDPYYQRVDSIGIDPSGNMVLTGTFTGNLDFGGGPLVGIAPGLGSDVYLAKLASNANLIFSQMFSGPGSPHDHQLRALGIDSAGNIAVSGVFDGTIDLGGGPFYTGTTYSMMIAKYSPTGKHFWSKALAGFDRSISFDSAGNVIAAVNAPTPIDFGTGTVSGEVLVKFDPSGNAIWSRGFGGVTANSVIADRCGNVIWTGYFEGSASLGGPPLVSAGLYDIFLAGYDSDGNYLFSSRYGDPAHQYLSRVTTTTNGELVMFGSYYGTITFGGQTFPNYDPTNRTEDLFIVKFH